jgi:hypothetical protein
VVKLKETIDVGSLGHSCNHQSKAKDYTNTEESDFGNEWLGLLGEKQNKCGNTSKG